MEKRERHSIFWALILIAIGVVFLLNSLGVLPGNAVELLIKLWPLLFILGGIDNIIRGRGWVWAVISLGLGTVFLLANFNYLPWDSWNLLLRLWPMILVAIGLDLIFEGRKPVTTIIGVLIGLLIMVAVAWFAILNSPGGQISSTAVSQPIGSATSAFVRISDPVGRLELSSGAGATNLLEGSVQMPTRMNLKQDYNVQNGEGSLNLSVQGEGFTNWTGSVGEPKWVFDLSNDLPLSLNTEIAVGSTAIDLTGLNIEQLNASVAVGSLTITLDPKDTFAGTIATPVGRMVVRIPEGTLAALQMDTAISIGNLPAGYRREGKMVYSPDANAANANVRLTLEQPIGLITLEVIK